MNRLKRVEERRSILALVFTDDHAADRFLAGLDYTRREAGVAVVGLF